MRIYCLGQKEQQRLMVHSSEMSLSEEFPPARTVPWPPIRRWQDGGGKHGKAAGQRWRPVVRYAGAGAAGAGVAGKVLLTRLY